MCQLRGLRVLQQERYQIYLHLLNLFYLIASLRSSDPAPCTIQPATLHRSLTSSKVPHQAQWSLNAISLAHSVLTCAPMLRRSSRGTVRCGVVCKIKTVDYLAICLFYLFLLVLPRYVTIYYTKTIFYLKCRERGSHTIYLAVVSHSEILLVMIVIESSRVTFQL